MNVRDALNLALDEELARDPLVYVMGEEVLLYSHFFLTCSCWWESAITLFRSIMVYGGTDNIMWNISSHSIQMMEYSMSIPQNIVMDMNNVMVDEKVIVFFRHCVDHICWSKTPSFTCFSVFVAGWAISRCIQGAWPFRTQILKYSSHHKFPNGGV